MESQLNSPGVWENIYLRCLEIDKSRCKANSLKELSAQLTTISEVIPPDIDPAEDFEYFVVSRLCLSVTEVLEQYLQAGKE